MSSLAIPEWVVATDASNFEDVALPQCTKAGAGTGTHYVEDSLKKSINCNPNGDQKEGRLPVMRQESANGSRLSLNQRLHDQDVEKGSFQPSNARADSKTAKRTPTNGGSPLDSRHSFKSVVPDLPTEWQVAARIKTSGASESTSSCCGRLRNTGSGSGQAVPVCGSAWWREAIARNVVLEFKKVVEVVRAKPVVLIPDLLVLGIVLGLGLWAVIAASNAEERFRRDSAGKIANDKALYIQTELEKTFMPAYVVATTVQQNPNYYPPQPPNLLDLYDSPWYLVNRPFDKLSSDLIALTKAGSIRTVSVIPHGVIRTMYPLKGRGVADDRNWGAIGKNWLNDVANAVPVKLSLTSRNLTIIGPYNLTQGGIGIVGMQSIFVNASRNDTFGIRPGPDNATLPTSSIPGMLDLLWQPSFVNAPRFWGLCTVLLSWDFLRDNVTNLGDLEAQGYDFVLTRPDKNSTLLAVDWSSGVDPQRPPGFNASALGSRPLIYYNLPSALREPVVVKVSLPNVEWTLYVSRTGGWKPTWRRPLIVMVVILSLVLSLLVFAVLVSRVQQQRLLRDVVEAAAKLASTTRTLEDEKNRMQALLVRHFDLIDLLEGGGSGGNDADGGTRSRIDILRQKMLLSGTSLRREHLGEEEQISIQELLGEGTFGKVYKGLWRGTEVAIKTIMLPAKMSGKEKREKMAVMEAAISSSLSHPNIVQTYTYHIRPMRDSSAAPSLSPPSAVQSTPVTAAANAVDASSSSGGAVTAAGTAAASTGNTGGVMHTKILADAGAIVVGSPESSIANNSINNTNKSVAVASAHAAVAAVAAGGAGGCGTELAAAAPQLPPTAQHYSARRVSLDQPASATAGIHSYEVQLVLEYCDRGCLRDALDAGAFYSVEGLNYLAILETAADIAKAMLHLHLNDILHSDLKATNVMLKSTDSGRGVTAKVADFGLSVRLDHTASHISHAFQGSLTHMAPEVMLQGHVSRASDVYAFGITMWETFTGGQPYKGTPGALLGHQTSKEGRRPIFPVGTPLAFRELAERCWAADAAARPPFSEILDLLMKMRSEIPGATPRLQPVMPLAKKMAAAMRPQQLQPGGVLLSQALSKDSGLANGGVGGGLAVGGGGGGGMYSGGDGGSTLGGSSGGCDIVPLHKIGGPAAILVGGRPVSLSAAIHSADLAASGGRLLPGNSAVAGATLAGLGFPGVLETITEAEESAALASMKLLQAASTNITAPLKGPSMPPMTLRLGPGYEAAISSNSGGAAAAAQAGRDGTGADVGDVKIGVVGLAMTDLGVPGGGGGAIVKQNEE